MFNRILKTAGVTLMAVAATMTTGSAVGSEETSPAPSADVTREDALATWPGGSPLVCIEDRTDGFPVAEAAADFEGLPVRLTVETDCSGHGNVVNVETRIDRETTHTAWFTGDRVEGRDDLFAGGSIWLNVDEAYRHTPESWTAAIRHELGHAVGLGHGDGHTVMHPTEYAEVGHLTEGDRVAVEDLYNKK